MTVEELMNGFTFTELTEDVLAECEHFSCGIDDLDEYFQKDVIGYTRRMVSRSYVFRSNSNPQQIACAFSVSNDSLRMTDLSNRKQEAFREENDLSEKRLKRYPGILIGRLAVNKAMAHQGIGTALMNFIKRWLGTGGKTGYRFLIVDARNTSDALAYYEKNGFAYLFASEEEESRSTRKDKAVVPQNTRLMFFDLMDLQPRKNPA